jgi:hypothetical protein
MGKMSDKQEGGRIVDSGESLGNTLLGNRPTYLSFDTDPSFRA